jgi:lysophospholipase L1-like esterase
MSKRIEELDPNFQDTASKIEDGLRWCPASDERFTVNGLPWFRENGGEFIRLPRRAKDLVRPPVWELGTMPSGGRVRFKTDTTTLKLRIEHSRAEIAMKHMCAVGVSGIDLYEGPPSRMTYWTSNKAIEAGTPNISTYFDKFPRRWREFTLYLPTYNDLTRLEIGMDPEATVRPPSPFRLPKPVVFYGTSITQGGCASRGANGYVPLMGRMLGVDVVNLGFSGNGRSDLEIADLMAEIDAACYVNDCIANMPIEDMKARYAAFNERLRAKRPDMPILLLTSIRWASEHYSPVARQSSRQKNAIVRAAFRRWRKRGDRHVHYLDCREIIGLDADHPSVDGAHLTDLGYKRMADGIAPVLKKILKRK